MDELSDVEDDGAPTLAAKPSLAPRPSLQKCVLVIQILFMTHDSLGLNCAQDTEQHHSRDV